MTFEPVAETNINVLSNYFDWSAIKVGGLQNKLKDNMNIDTNMLWRNNRAQAVKCP